MPSCHLVCSSTIVIVIVSAIWIVSFSPLNCQVSIFISAGPVPGSMPEKKVLPKYFLWTVMLEKTLENTMDCKKIKPVNPKGNLPWIFIGRTDAEAPILWPPDVKSQLIRKDPDDRKDWGKVEKGMTEDKIFGWHHRLNRHWANSRRWWKTEKPGCCRPWGRRVRHHWATEWQQQNISRTESKWIKLNWLALHCTETQGSDCISPLTLLWWLMGCLPQNHEEWWQAY